MLRIAIADDHPLFRDAIRLALNDLSAPDGLEVIEAANADDAMGLAEAHPDLDLLLLDLHMPGMDGLAGLLAIRRRHPSLPIGIVSASDDADIARHCLKIGVMAFVPKRYDKASITEAVQEVLDGRVHRPSNMGLCATSADGPPAETSCIAAAMKTLTAQQMRVLKAIAKGRPNKIIAHDLGIAEKTVKAHATEVFRKLGVNNRTQAVLAVKDLLGR